MIRIASFNVENLYERPKAFISNDWAEGQPALDAYHDVNILFSKKIYSPADKQKICDLLVVLDIYYINDSGAIRRKDTQNPRWAWLRKNRGKFDSQPGDETKNIEIIAEGRNDWIGWVELAKSPTNEIATRMTAQVIKDVGANIMGIVEAEDRPSLVRFNQELLGGLFQHVMLLDGNDERGIDVGIMTGNDFTIESIRSNVDAKDNIGIVFSRDCPEYEIHIPSGEVIYILLNHFKSQSGGGGAMRRRQAAKVREIVNNRVAKGQHVIVLGDLNEGPKQGSTQAVNLLNLYNNNSPLVDCYSLPYFQVGKKPGSFDSCGITDRFDYIFISQSLQPHFTNGGLFRKGLWGSRKTRPTDWITYEEITKSVEQASDHAAIFIDLDI